MIAAGDNLKTYDPTRNPNSQGWLSTDEGERIELVASYHRRAHVRLPSAQLHATIHVIVENQLALGEQVVVDTLARLQVEGLDRHDAVHAIGSVLAEHFYELLKESPTVKHADPNAAYFDRLKQLTAAGSRNAG